MFIIIASVDDNEAYVDREFEGEALTGGLVASLVSSLDGLRHTLMTLSPGGEGHMAVGGSATEGLVVYMTEDNVSFHNLTTAESRESGSVSVVAGGQLGDYDSRYVVTAEEATTAAEHYARTGALAGGLVWEAQE